MALDLTSFAAMLKTRYPDDVVKNQVYAKNPFFALVPKMEDFTGDSMKVPTIYGNPQNRSATFSTANSVTSQTASAAFFLTRKSDYSIAEIKNEVLLASEGKPGAFAEAATTEIDGALNTLARSLSISLYRSGSGSIGQIGSISTSTITLSAPEHVTNFEVGMTLQISSTDGASGLRSGTVTVAGVDRSAGTVTCSTAVTTGVAAAVAGDYIIQAGDADAKLTGLAGWLPHAADNRSSVLGSSFYGVTRSADATRLGGISFDGSGYPIEEAIIGAEALVAREGGSPDHLFMHYSDLANLKKALGSKVHFVDVAAGYEGQVGFRGIMIDGNNGPIKVIGDQNCLPGRGFMLQLDTWKLASLKSAVNLFEGDGLKLLRSATADSLQLRCFSYANLYCQAPGWNAHIKFR